MRRPMEQSPRINSNKTSFFMTHSHAISKLTFSGNRRLQNDVPATVTSYYLTCAGGVTIEPLYFSRILGEANEEKEDDKQS